MTHTDSAWSNRGDTFSVAHGRLCYHFRPVDDSGVEVSVVDFLNVDASINGAHVTDVPQPVRDELRAEGLRIRL